MRFIFLSLAIFMLTVLTVYGQDDNTKKVDKKIIVIQQTENGESIRREYKSEQEMEIRIDNPKLDSLLQMILMEMGISEADMIVEKRTKVDLDPTKDASSFTVQELMSQMNDDVQTKRIIVKTSQDGDNSVMEWEEEIEEKRIDRDNETPMPKVKMGIELNAGNQINKVSAGSAAEKAGLQAGDVITKIDSQIIYSYTGLMEHLTSYQPSDKIKVTFLRGGKEKSTKLVLQGR